MNMEKKQHRTIRFCNRMLLRNRLIKMTLCIYQMYTCMVKTQYKLIYRYEFYTQKFRNKEKKTFIDNK